MTQTAASMHGLRLPVAKLSRSLLLFLLIIALTYASLLTFQGLVAEKTRLEERLAALEDELARCRADGDACTVKTQRLRVELRAKSAMTPPPVTRREASPSACAPVSTSTANVSPSAPTSVMSAVDGELLREVCRKMNEGILDEYHKGTAQFIQDIREQVALLSKENKALANQIAPLRVCCGQALTHDKRLHPGVGGMVVIKKDVKGSSSNRFSYGAQPKVGANYPVSPAPADGKQGGALHH
eukprot:jgi/Mesvir1/24913/Mv16901-RA.1